MFSGNFDTYYNYVEINKKQYFMHLNYYDYFIIIQMIEKCHDAVIKENQWYKCWEVIVYAKCSQMLMNYY